MALPTVRLRGSLKVPKKIPGSHAFAEHEQRSTGHLVLVVGPSGAGKDSVIDGLKALFAAHPRVYFPTRFITRPVDAGGEVHIYASDERFEQLQATGALFLSWTAHGHRYGIPADVDRRLRVGDCVICNVSRTVISPARRRYPHTHVMLVTASPATLKRRLRARGREDDADIARRVQRAQDFEPDGSERLNIRNDGELNKAVSQASEFVAGLLSTAR